MTTLASEFIFYLAESANLVRRHLKHILYQKALLPKKHFFCRSSNKRSLDAHLR